VKYVQELEGGVCEFRVLRSPSRLHAADDLEAAIGDGRRRNHLHVASGIDKTIDAGAIHLQRRRIQQHLAEALSPTLHNTRCPTTRGSPKQSAMTILFTSRAGQTKFGRDGILHRGLHSIASVGRSNKISAALETSSRASTILRKPPSSTRP
jgi:hypothetical protein